MHREFFENVDVALGPANLLGVTWRSDAGCKRL
jgi:hypothetical protein